MRCLAPFLIAILPLGLSGCGNDGGPKLYTVEGKITLNNKALESGNVNFHADDPKGGGSSGLIGNGFYTITVPKGKYKVTVTPPMGDDVPKIADAKYGDVSKTPLALEVVPSPAAGVYDLKLTK